MATKKRISVPSAIAHIMVRGIEGRELFHDDTDRHYYLQLRPAKPEVILYEQDSLSEISTKNRRYFR
ncbi:MAG: hypothetical protein JW795_09115, partial [Chitinivibrionales bacterium]|nr:hypothetical protein [Chitinivibrionales bacterium]